MGNTGSSERATRDIGHPAHDRRGKYPPDYPWSGSGGGRNAGDSYSSDYDAPPVAYPAYHPPPEGYPPLGYPAAPENTRPQRRPTPPRAPPAPSSAAAKRPKLLGRFSRIGDDFTSLDQVTRSVDTGVGRLSPQEQKTVDAIVKASEFPLSIILVGVGDGPWDTMKEFDDYIPNRSFDNFQFVNYTEIMMKNISESRKEREFALAALMEIPLQYKATLELGMISGRVASCPKRNPRPPPIGSSGGGSFGSKVFGSTAVRENATSYSDYKAAHIRAAPATAAPAVGASSEPQVCPVCLSNPKKWHLAAGT